MYLALFFLSASALVDTTREPSGGNGLATSKSFHVAGEYGVCSQWTFAKDCTEAQILASSSSIPHIDNDGNDGLTIGECPDEFEKACDMLYKTSSGGEFGSPITISADKTSGCGEAEYVLLTDDCDTCGKIATLSHWTGEMLEEPTCKVRGSEGFIKDFINKLKEGELLYIGIAAAAVLVPLICCICCCCCLLNAGSSPKVTYLSRV